MSKHDALELLDELEQLGAIVRIEDDERLNEALAEIGVEDE